MIPCYVLICSSELITFKLIKHHATFLHQSPNVDECKPSELMYISMVKACPEETYLLARVKEHNIDKDLFSQLNGTHITF